MFWFSCVPVALSVLSVVIASVGLRVERDLAAPPILTAEAQAKFQALRTPEYLDLAANARRMILVATLGPSSCILFVWLGIVTSVHLKEMLGTPTSRLIPGLARTHLALAGVFVVVLTFAYPLAASLALGLVDSWFVFVACALSIFALSMCLAHLGPLALSAIWVVVALFAFAMILKDDVVRVPSATQAAAMVAASTVGAMIVGARLAGFNEEMPEYRRRFPTRVGDLFGTSPGPAGSVNPLYLWYAPYLWFSPAKDRHFSRSRGANLPESIIERARHWHAANRSARSLVLLAPFIGGLMGAMAHLNGWSLQQLVGSPNMSYFAVFPVIMLLGPQYRRFLALDSLRPYSRREFANAVGLALVTMVAASWLLMLTTACIVTLCFHPEFPSAVGLVRSILFSSSCVPILFGVAAWPHRTMLVFYAYSGLFGVMASFTLIPLRLDEFPIPRLELISLGMLAIGLLITRASYVRWLNEDLDAIPLASRMRQ
jgi:hypothetical protein